MTLTKDERDLIRAMCKNDLNISAAGRELYFHRNTIVLHLDRLRQKTGLDGRTFYGAARLLLLSMRED